MTAEDAIHSIDENKGSEGEMDVELPSMGQFEVKLASKTSAEENEIDVEEEELEKEIRLPSRLRR